MITREIVDAYLFTHPDGVERWTIQTRNEDGTLHSYLIPSEAFENLAVEYGFDPDDIDTLLKVAMLQPHIPEPRMPSNHGTDPAARKGYVRNGKPVVLETAASTDEAREALLERIRWVEENKVRIVEPKPGGRRKLRALDIDPHNDVEIDPYERLQALKATYRPDKMRMQEKRQRLRAILGRDV